eukprot:g2055.t1
MSSRAAGIITLGSISLSTAALGYWQAKRYYWKVDLMQRREAALASAEKNIRIEDSNKDSNGILITEKNSKDWSNQRLHIVLDDDEDKVDDLSNIQADFKKNTEDNDEDPLLYRPVRASGIFRDQDSLLLGPTAPPKDSQASRFTHEKQGYYLLTPLELVDEDVKTKRFDENEQNQSGGSLSESSASHSILVNRGWIPAKRVPRFMRSFINNGPHSEEGKSKENTSRSTVIGLLDQGHEEKGSFVPSNEKSIQQGKLFWLDMNLVQQITGVDVGSHVLVATEPTMDSVARLGSSISGDESGRRNGVWPLTKNKQAYMSFPVGPEQHVGYAVSWFGMSIFGILMTFKKFRRK